MDKKLLLIVNPNAGQRRANRFLADIIQLYNNHGYECVVFVTSAAGDTDKYIEENKTVFDRIVCIGGDGTLNETIAGLARHGIDCPVGYIPAGTTNDYASSIGLSGDILTAARDSVEGVPVQFDMGYFNGRFFNYTASCGAFARASYETPQTAKNALGHLAYILEGIKDIPNLRPIHMKIEAGGHVFEDDYIFCSVTNSLSVGGILKLDPVMVSMNDGLFEVMIIKYPKTPVELTRVLASLSNNDFPNELIGFFAAKHIKFTVDEEIEWTLDGERGSKGYEFEVENLHNKMKLILPKESLLTIPADVEKYPPMDVFVEEEASEREE